MFDQQPTPEQLDTVTLPPLRHPNYDTPEGRLFREALALIEVESRWAKFIREERGAKEPRYCALGAIGESYNGNPWFAPNENPVEDAVVGALAKTIAAVDTGDAMRSYWAADMPQAVVASHNNSHTHEEHMAVWRQCGRDNGWL